MRSPTTALGVCAVLGLFCTAVYAQKTTVTVERGEVRAKTSNGEVTVEAGQKAVLTPGQKPITGVNDPMVDELLRIAKLIEAEKAAKKTRIDGALISICSVETDNHWKVAFLSEVRNKTSKPSRVDHIGNLGDLVEPRFYDMEGRVLKFDWKKGKDNQGPCDVYMLDPVEPGASFRYVCVGHSIPPERSMRRDGKIWHLWQANDSSYFLNYFRFILPKSAILTQTNRPALVAGASDGRLAVTIRNYTGAEADGEVDVAFLWPNKDGSSLEDVLAETRDRRDAWRDSVTKDYQRTMARIRAGEDFNDQSTPLATLLTRNAAMLHNNRERVLATVYATTDAQRKEVQQEIDRLEKGLGGMQGVCKVIVDPVKTIQTAEWPKQPDEGATHKIVMYGDSVEAGPVFTMGLVFRKGRWYIVFNRPGPGHPEKEKKSGREATTAPSK